MKHRKHGFARGLALTLVLFVLMVSGALWLVQKVETTSADAETEIVREAVRSAVLTCYAVEGVYPLELDYLKEHYGLAFDEERYIVSYSAFASNVMPEIRVMEKGDVE